MSIFKSNGAASPTEGPVALAQPVSRLVTQIEVAAGLEGTIASSRTGYLNGTTDGWAAKSLFVVGSNLYAVVLDTAAVKIRVHKGSGNGTWVEQDAANAPTHTGATSSYDAAQFSNFLYACYRTAATTLRVRRFNTSTDVWETTDIGAADASTTALAAKSVTVVVRSDADVIVAYQIAALTPNYRVYEGSSWAAQVEIEGTSAHMFDAILTGNSDMIHFTYYDTANDLTNRSLSNTNVLGTAADIDATSLSHFANFGGYVNDAGTHRIATFNRDSTGDGTFFYSTSSAAPAYTQVTAVTPTTVTDPGIMGSVVLAHQSKWYVIWSGDARAEIHMDVSDDYATPAFGTDTNVITGLAAIDPAVYAISTPTGIPVLYTVLTATPTVGIVWAVGAPPVATPPRSQIVWVV